MKMTNNLCTLEALGLGGEGVRGREGGMKRQTPLQPLDRMKKEREKRVFERGWE